MAAGSADLPTDVETLQAMVVAMQEREAQLRHIIDQLQRWRFGPRSEKLSLDQYDLALEDREIASAEAHALLEQQQETARRAKGERKVRQPGESRPSVPAHLPHVEQVLLPDATSCPCCGGALHEIDRDIAKRLDKVPARYRVIVTIRPKLACRTCSDGVLQAPAPIYLVPGGLPTDALVADVVVSKYADQLPLYRQEQILKRHGIEIDRATLCELMPWMPPSEASYDADQRHAGAMEGDGIWQMFISSRSTWRSGAFRSVRQIRAGRFYSTARYREPSSSRS